IAITDKKGLREGKSLKKTTKYASKMKTVHVGHLINLLQSPNVASREPVIIGIEHLKTEYRDLSIVNSDSKTIS
ncbi:MAG: hypothetical protein OEZ01_17475, partial [Candidatus Heimdallarchaeota archaeon]|nr:hypothetical protein [Candidatus Heimdallarchaeota archaeon]